VFDGLAAAKIDRYHLVFMVSYQKVVQAAGEGEVCRAHERDFIPIWLNSSEKEKVEKHAYSP
jgi:hypothetical protein